MPDIDIDKLQIEVSASSEDATKKIRKLASSMRSLKKALAETNGVNSLANSLRSLSSAIKDAGATVEMANAIKSIGRQEAKIGDVADYLLGISKMDFSTSWNTMEAPAIFASISSINRCSFIKKVSAALRKAPLPQAGSRMVICNNQLRYSLRSSNRCFFVSFCLLRSEKYSSSFMPNACFFSAQSFPTVFSTIYLVI